jgi:cytochrome c-type biogenesis protein CcmH
MNRASLFFIILIFLYSLPPHVFAQEKALYPFPSDDETARFDSFIKEIRCVVCQNQSLADSNAPLANDLRQTIYEMMIHKKTDEEVKNYLVKRYGEFILLKPRMNKETWLLWLFPPVGLASAFFCLFSHLRTQKKSHSECNQ